MYSKTSILALCAAAAVQEVSAAHGHQHVHPNKRDVVWAATDTVVVTDWVTVTLTEGELSAAAVPTSTKKQHHHHSVVTTTSSSSSSTSSSSASPSSVVESSAPAEPSAPAPAPATSSTSTTSTSTSTSVPAPAPTTTTPVVVPTTMITSTSTAPAETTPDVPAVSVPVTSSATPTTTSATTKAPAPSAASGGKLGLAYTDASFVEEFNSLGGHASWAYDWGTSTDGDLPEGVTYIPMLWGTDADHSAAFPAAAEAAIALGDASLLSFNEPDISSQANMDPTTAASAHITWFQPYIGQAQISAPAISSSQNAGQGIDWLNQFFTACAGQCQVDFCVGHWYGPGGDDGAAEFLQYATDLNTACDGKPVWITEFQATSGDVNGFLSSVLSSMESDAYSFVEKYSYFLAEAGSGYLFDSATSLSAVGQIYAGLTS